MDTRKQLAENLFVVGGCAMAPGFKSRLLNEVKSLLQTSFYSSKLPIESVKMHIPPAKDNYTCWLGGIVWILILFLNLCQITLWKVNK